MSGNRKQRKLLMHRTQSSFDGWMGEGGVQRNKIQDDDMYTEKLTELSWYPGCPGTWY